jgi:hypothetical protein
MEQTIFEWISLGIQFGLFVLGIADQIHKLMERKKK